MTRLVNLLRLYRLDAALITFFSFLFGVYLAGTAINNLSILTALYVSLIPINFIYSVNSWFDRKIDAINKPERPLSSGKISETTALWYIRLLFLLSIICPFIFTAKLYVLLLFWSLPMLGILYSNNWYPFKKKMLLSVLTTSLILVLPMCLGAAMVLALSFESVMVLLMFLLYCLFTIPLKDIEDIKGDVAYNSENWAHTFGIRRLIIVTSLLHVLLLITALIYVEKPNNLFIAGICFLSFTVELVFIIWNLNPARLYGTVIKSVVLSGFTFFILLRYLDFAKLPVSISEWLILK